MNEPKLVLASASPRRADLLRMLGLEFEVDPARGAEERLPGEAPEAYVIRLAREKAAEVVARRPGALVLAGDTVVVLDDAVLEKPTSDEDAVRMLIRLAGREHDVLTGLALAGPNGELRGRLDRASVRFRPFDEGVARAYVRTGEPMDKAGAYGIQSMGAALVERVEGDFYTVMGLSVHGLGELLRASGFEYRFGRLQPVRSDRAGASS